MEPEKVDLSALDPTRDAARWETLVARTVARSIAARRRASVPALVSAWARPALAVAASFALVSWGAVYFIAPKSTAAATTKTDPATALATWARTGKLPDTTSLLETLGGSDER